MSLATLSPAMKHVRKYLIHAKQVEKVDMKMAYFCRMKAAQDGQKASNRTKEDTAYLVQILDWLENNNSAVANLSADERKAHAYNFALNVFINGDNEDRAGKANENTAKCFMAAYTFFDVCLQFGPLPSDLEQKMKYAAWKAADIRKALREGRTPTPGAPGEGLGGDGLDELGMLGFGDEGGVGGGNGSSTNATNTPSNNTGGLSTGGYGLGGSSKFTANDINTTPTPSTPMSNPPNTQNPFASSTTNTPSRSTTPTAPGLSPKVAPNPPPDYPRGAPTSSYPSSSYPSTTSPSMSQVNSPPTSSFSTSLPTRKPPSPAATRPQAAYDPYASSTLSSSVNSYPSSSPAVGPSNFQATGNRGGYNYSSSGGDSGNATSNNASDSLVVHANRAFPTRPQTLKEAERLCKHAVSSIAFEDCATAVSKLSEALALLLPYREYRGGDE